MNYFHGAGKVAKIIYDKKHTRLYWNVVFGVFILIIIIVFLAFLFQFMCDRMSYEESRAYVEYKDRRLITDGASFDIPDLDKQEVDIKFLTKNVKEGDELILKISSITGELLEARKEQKIVYKKAVIDPVANFVGWLLLGFPILVLCVFMLVVTNIKKPGRLIDKLQRTYLIRHYE